MKSGRFLDSGSGRVGEKGGSLHVERLVVLLRSFLIPKKLRKNWTIGPRTDVDVSGGHENRLTTPPGKCFLSLSSRRFETLRAKNSQSLDVQGHLSSELFSFVPGKPLTTEAEAG
ncbi:MAG: hypothetical protein ACYCT5_13635 [Leptospirillum sp.]